MATQITLKSKTNDRPWYESLAPLDDAVAVAFEASTLETISFEPESGTLRLGLLMHSVPEDGSAFACLKKELGADIRHLLLQVNYAPGALTAMEYLALHFDDLVESWMADLALESHWTGRLDYEVGTTSLTLLAQSSLIVERLKMKRAHIKFSDLLRRGCGEELEVEIKTGDFSALAFPALSEPPAQQEAVPAAPVPPIPNPASRPQETILLGRKISEEKVRQLTLITEEENSVCAQGEIFLLEELTLKSGRVKVKFAVSDGSDSILVIYWPKPGESRPKGLAMGAFVRVRGDVKPDKYEKDELVMELSDLTLLPKKTPRKDQAVSKRVELHAHTKMSAADAVADPVLYVQRAAQWGHPAVGITDHGVVHAFPEAAKAAKKAGIKLLLGMEAYLCNDVSFLNERARAGAGKPGKLQATPYYHVVLYAKNELGRRHLYDLVSHSHIHTFYKKPLLPRELLIEKREGLVLGSACEMGELIQAILQEKGDAELEQIASFYDYFEVQPLGNNSFLIKNGTVSSQEGLKAIVRKVIALGKKLGKPVVATSDMHFLDPEDELYRRIMQVGNGMADAEEQPPLYFHTTDEMKAEFAWLEDEALIEEIVVMNAQKIAAQIDHVPPVPEGRYFPELPGSEEKISKLCQARAREIYGDPLPELVEKRLERELKAIVGNKFAVLYEIARQLVEESNKKGYSVGSRGSVGSSLAAYLLHISEVNPLPAHERCPSCHWSEFDDKQRLSGVDLKSRPCPKCGGELKRDGHNIPFETFVGFKGDKVPDIDLNFAPEVQGEIQKYAETLFGEGKAFKAGTISTLAEKTAFGYVRKYFDSKNQPKRRAEVERVKAGLEGVKRTSGQHPGGVILVRHDKDINDFTPVQYSGDGKELGGKEGSGVGTLLTTHFDYHALDENLVKLDILGKDDASAFKHLQELTGVAEIDVPLNDPTALSLFSSQAALSYPKLTQEEKDIYGDTGAVAIPEFGTANTRRMLEMTRPKNFTELIYISGLSHGTDVWAGNAETLLKEGKAKLDTVISTRDDIMNTLMRRGMEPGMAFAITEKVRKGAVAHEGFSPEHEKALKDIKMETWWVDSCRKIKYMFPKAHAAAYCFTAARMAWYKVHHARAFYASWLTLHATDLEAEFLSRGRAKVLERLRQLKALRAENNATAKEEAAFSTLVVAYEALLRGLSFDEVDIYKSHPNRFMPGSSESALLPPLVSLAGLGETAAANLDRERKGGPFRSVEDLAKRAGLNKTVIEKLSATGALDVLPRTDQITLF